MSGLRRGEGHKRATIGERRASRAGTESTGSPLTAQLRNRARAFSAWARRGGKQPNPPSRYPIQSGLLAWLTARSRARSAKLRPDRGRRSSCYARCLRCTGPSFSSSGTLYRPRDRAGTGGALGARAVARGRPAAIERLIRQATASFAFGRMFAFGTKRTCSGALHMSAIGGKADIARTGRNVRK